MVQGDTQAPAISSLLIRTVSVDLKVSITHYLMVLIQTSRKSDHSSDNWCSSTWRKSKQSQHREWHGTASFHICREQYLLTLLGDLQGKPSLMLRKKASAQKHESLPLLHSLLHRPQDKPVGQNGLGWSHPSGRNSSTGMACFLLWQLGELFNKSVDVVPATLCCRTQEESYQNQKWRGLFILNSLAILHDFLSG